MDLHALARKLGELMRGDAIDKLLEKVGGPKNTSFDNDRGAIIRDVRKLEHDLHGFTHAQLHSAPGDAIRG